MKKISLIFLVVFFTLFKMATANEFVLPSGGIMDANYSINNISSNNDKAQSIIYLKRNRKWGVNMLVQSMFSETNVKYVICYHYTLGEDIILPDNCSLIFQGGSIRGKHTLTGQDTRIEAETKKIINTDVILTGTWDVNEAYPEWFGATGKGINDDTVAIQSCLNAFDVVFFPNKIYNITQIFPQNNQIIRFSEGCTLRASRLLKPTIPGVPGESMIKIFQKNNVFIEGNNVVIDMRKNDYPDHITGDGSGGYERHCVTIQSSQDIRIIKLNTINSLGDGFCLKYPQGGNNVDVDIIGCNGNNNTRQGLSIVDGTNVNVEDCTFSNTNGAANGPWAGIDIEPNYYDHGYKINNIYVNNCRFINNEGAGVLIANSLYDDGTNRNVNITVKDCIAENCNCGISLQNFMAYQAKGSINFENFKVQGLVFANVGCWGGNSNLPVFINNCCFEKTQTVPLSASYLQNSIILVTTPNRTYDNYIGDIFINNLQLKNQTKQSSSFVVCFNPKHTGKEGKILKNFIIHNIIVDESQQFNYYTGYGPVYHADKYDLYINYNISFSLPMACGAGFYPSNYQSVKDVLLGNGGKYYLMDYKKMPGMVVRYIIPKGAVGICTFMINDAIPIYNDKNKKLTALIVKDPASFVANGREISVGEYIEFTAQKKGWVITDMSEYMRKNLIEMEVDE